MDASDYQKIRQLFDNYIRMYSLRDDLLTSYFSEDFTGITGSGDFLVKDREAWIAITRQDFAQVKDPINIELKDLAIQLLADTIAVATSTFIIHLPIKEHVLSRKTARLVLIFRNEPTGWKISHSSISVSFGVAGDDEIYPLKDLEERNRRLEELITDRTAQLSEANDKLHQTNELLEMEIAEHKQLEIAKLLDVSERKKTEKALIESEERFRSVMENVPNVAVQGYALDGTVFFWNRASETLYGYSAEETVGANFLELIIPPEMREGVKEAVARMEESGIPIPAGELLLKRKDGSRVPVFSSHALLNPVGRQPELFCLDVDLTERKKAEQLLSYSISLTDAALESTADGILIVDRSGMIVRWNQKFVTLWNVPKELLVNGVIGPVLKYVTAQMAQPDEFFAKVMQLYDHPENSSHELFNLADGRLFDRYSQPLKIGDEIVGRFWSFRDITEQKKHDNEQMQIDKLESLGLLAGGIAHDFNNILTGIMGNVSFAQIFLDHSHKSYKPLVEAEKASVRASELAHQLLTFARGGEPIRKVISLRNLVKETVDLVLRGTNIKGIVEISDLVDAIDADEGQMSQVLHNLIINASQAMPGGGTLTAAAQNETLADNNALPLPPGRYVRLTVSDQGCGIPDDVMKKIFDPYFTTKSAGNGLGLASAHSVINRHGGHIGASSVVGKGTTFTIHLPSIGETYSNYQTASTSQDTGNHSGGAILVMDDEEMILDMTSELLEYLGYQVTTCVNGAEAVTRYKAARESGKPFLAVIMDLTIPGGMGGKDAAQQILANDSKACLIVSSGYSNDPIMSDYVTYGFAAAVAKPYNIKDFGKLLSDVLSAQ